MQQKANDSMEVNRFLFKHLGSPKQPTVVFFGGVHGNEPAGVCALNRLKDYCLTNMDRLNGNVFAIAGNRSALSEGKRFHLEDLNRMWTKDKIEKVKLLQANVRNHDQKEQIELLSILDKIIEDAKGPLYFFDLHTTSSETVPFTTVNDSLINRKFAEKIPVPMILGIEEYLDGPLLSYINELGYVSFGFEGGQHQSNLSIENHYSFALLSLQIAGVLDLDPEKIKQLHIDLAQNAANSNSIFEIYYRHALEKSDRFKMKEGYVNFQKIQKGQLLAKINGESLYADYNAQIFMPLYQTQGDDAFFAVRTIPKWVLSFSAFLRKNKVDRILTFLPGVQWATLSKNTLMVNKSIARFFAKEVMHLMGYRSRYFDKEYLLMKNREADSKTLLYTNAQWMK